MNEPAHIGVAARLRIQQQAEQIQRSLDAIGAGRPGDAEPEMLRRSAVLQRRIGLPVQEAAREAPRSGAEKVWGKTIDFVDVAFLQRGAYAARAVARIATRDGQGLGTGFMISPVLFLTNNHVIGSKADAADLLVEFDYERDLAGRPRVPTRFAFAPEACFLTNDQDDLDYTVLAVGGRLSGPGTLAGYSFLPISAARDKHQLGDHANIVQHPDGRLKEAVLRENQLVSRASTTLHYVADTEPGSSGSPVFNVLWQVIALHHWGSPHRDLLDQNGKRIAKTVNEGIRISAIVTDMNTRKSGLPAREREKITEAIAAGLDPQVLSSVESAPAVAHDASLGASVDVASDGTATWTIPLRVSVQLGGYPARGPAQDAAPQLPAAAMPPGTGEEARVQVDPDYGNRDGYQPDFLPGVAVPLPKPRGAAALRAVSVNTRPKAGRPRYELAYEHFSVVMHKERRLACFTATNIDGRLAKSYDRSTGVIAAFHPGEEEADEAPEASELWFIDPRIPEEEQTPPALYAGQTAYDAQGAAIVDKRKADHANRIFQQGHLTRRQDPLWGPDDIVVRANADTFHVTNRSPQVGFFNMGKRKPGAEAVAHAGGTLYWRALEDFALNNAVADQARVSVFTGPIFDDENDIPWDRGMPEMAGFKAPREYWKIVLRVEDGRLQATALSIDQTPLIDYVPETALSEAALARVSFEKVKRYHVSIAELERRTSLDFGAKVRAADTHRGGERREVASLSQLLNVARTGTPSRSAARPRYRAS